MTKLIFAVITALLVSLSTTVYAQENKDSKKTESVDEKPKKDKKKKDKKKKKKGKAAEAESDSLVIGSLKDSASYSLGLLIAQNLKQQGISEVSYEHFVHAMNDFLSDSNQLIPIAQTQTILMQYMEEQKRAQYADKIKEGENFLAENAKREEVNVLPSGLQYEVISMGDGAVPTKSSKVKTHYHGTLIDGTVFDSSVDRGQPIEFAVTGVISGWTEALQLMPVGSKWKLYIPYDLAYGANPRPGGAIQPYDVLIFEIELISIVQ